MAERGRNSSAPESATISLPDDLIDELTILYTGDQLGRELDEPGVKRSYREGRKGEWEECIKSAPDGFKRKIRRLHSLLEKGAQKRDLTPQDKVQTVEAVFDDIGERLSRMLLVDLAFARATKTNSNGVFEEARSLRKEIGPYPNSLRKRIMPEDIIRRVLVGDIPTPANEMSPAR